MQRSAEDDRRLIELLRELGATDEEVATADAAGNLGPLAMELSLRRQGPLMTIAEVAALSGNDRHALQRMWRSLGLFDDEAAPAALPPDAVEALNVLAFLAQHLSEPDVIAFARVIGSSTATLAAALSNTTRVGVEVPGLVSGTPYSAMVRAQTDTVRELLPVLWDAIGAVFRRHLALVSAQPWHIDDDHAAVTVDTNVGFVDVVASTELLLGSSPAELARLVDRFEQLVWDGVTLHGGRVVKLIGDEAMFTVPSAEAALATARDILRAGDRVRIGLASGTAIAYHGDLYGPTVNLAARLVSLAQPGTALVSASVAAADMAAFDHADVGEIRGFPTGTAAFVLR